MEPDVGFTAAAFRRGALVRCSCSSPEFKNDALFISFVAHGAGDHLHQRGPVSSDKVQHDWHAFLVAYHIVENPANGVVALLPRTCVHNGKSREKLVAWFRDQRTETDIPVRRCRNEKVMA